MVVFNLQAQSQLAGRVVNQLDNEKAIPNAVLMTNQQRYFFSDFDGSFSILLQENEFVDKVFANGFKSIQAADEDLSLIQLKEDHQHSEQAIQKKDIIGLTAQQLLPTNFDFKSLSKTTISNTEADFILRKDIHLKLTQSQGLQQKYKAISVEGLEGAVPKMVNTEIHSFNWFQNYIEIFDKQFVSPFNQLNLINVRFYSLFEDDHIHVISFQPLKRGFIRSLEGVIVYDKSSSKLSKIHAISDGDFRLNLQTEFNTNTGLPEQTKLRIKPGKGGTNLSFFGGGMSFGRIQQKNPKGDAELVHQQVYYDVNVHDSISAFPSTLTKVLEDKTKYVPNSYWDNFDFPFLNLRDSDAKLINSYFEEANIRKKVNRLSAFDAGYFPIGILDVDLTRLFKLNNYEGVRLGIGVLTNESLSEKYRLGGFAAYGFQDTNLKYGFNAGLLLNSDSSTWLNAFFADDIEEVGMNNFLTDQRVYSLFEPRLVNITFFYKYQKHGLSLQHNFTPQLMSELKVDKSSISQTRDYAFLNDGRLFEDYNLTTATFGLRWTPNYTYSKVGKRIYVNKASTPEVTAQISQSFRGVMDGDFNFTKLSAKLDYEFLHSWGSLSSVELGGDIGFGDIPLMHTFHAFPNSPNKAGVFNRFSVAGVKSFETMYFNEFFNTKLATLHLKHKLTPFKLSNTIQPELVLISRHAIGDFDSPENHQNIAFDTLSQGFNEAGFELNKLFFGFGLSFAYRYGAYHLPRLEDNFSFKFTFYLKL